MSTDRKVAVIMGASRGIGAALVRAYRERDYLVVATARSVAPSSDADILAVPGDIGARKTAERVIAEGVARFGRIDTLVNNAGIFVAKPFTRYTEADFAAVLTVNIAGFFHVTQPSARREPTWRGCPRGQSRGSHAREDFRGTTTRTG